MQGALATVLVPAHPACALVLAHACHAAQQTRPRLQYSTLLARALHAAPLAGIPCACEAAEALWHSTVTAATQPNTVDALYLLVTAAAPVVAAYAPAALTTTAAEVVQALLRRADGRDGAAAAVGAVVRAAQDLGWTLPHAVRMALAHDNAFLIYTISRAYLFRCASRLPRSWAAGCFLRAPTGLPCHPAAERLCSTFQPRLHRARGRSRPL